MGSIVYFMYFRLEIHRYSIDPSLPPGVAQGAVSGDLEELAAAGILRRDTRGNHVFHQADAKSPISEELKSVFIKAAGLADELRRAHKPLGSHGPDPLPMAHSSGPPKAEASRTGLDA